jgi:hypothetical protein
LAIEIRKEFVVAVALFASVAVTVKSKSPAIEGVPEITPPELIVTPVGNEPVAVKVLAPEPPLAVTVNENAVLKVPDNPVVGVVMVTAEDIVRTAALDVAVAVVELIEFVTTTVKLPASPVAVELMV